MESMAVELVQEIGRRITVISDDPRPKKDISVQTPVCSPLTGECGLCLKHNDERVNSPFQPTVVRSLSIFMSVAFCW